MRKYLFIINNTNILEQAGLKLRLSDNNLILNNIIENNYNCNILIEGSNKNIFMGNNISESYNGILITNYPFLSDKYNISFSQKNSIKEDFSIAGTSNRRIS